MSGKQTILSPLELRKQLLIAESEINRTRLRQDWQVLAGELTLAAERARSLNTMTSSLVPLIAAGLATFTRSRTKTPSAGISWLQKATTGVRLVSSLWQLFRPHHSEHKS